MDKIQFALRAEEGSSMNVLGFWLLMSAVFLTAITTALAFYLFPYGYLCCSACLPTLLLSVGCLVWSSKSFGKAEILADKIIADIEENDQTVSGYGQLIDCLKPSERYDFFGFVFAAINLGAVVSYCYASARYGDWFHFVSIAWFVLSPLALILWAKFFNPDLNLPMSVEQEGKISFTWHKNSFTWQNELIIMVITVFAVVAGMFLAGPPRDCVAFSPAEGEKAATEIIGSIRNIKVQAIYAKRLMPFNEMKYHVVSVVSRSNGKHRVATDVCVTKDSRGWCVRTQKRAYRLKK